MSDLKTYSIKLDIEQGDKVNSQISAIKSSLSDIQKQTKAFNFDDAARSLNRVRNGLIDSAQAGEDISKAIESYDKSVKKLTDDLSKQAVILNHSMTEQGKAERERLKALDAMTARTKEQEAERRRLAQTVVRGTDDEIKAMIAKNKQLRISAKLSTLELREQTKQRKTLKDLIKSDLSGISALIKKQKEFIQSLKTTEGRYNALKKAGSFASKTALKVGAGVAGAAVGFLGAGVAGAVSSAGNEVAKYSAMRRIKGFGDDEKEAIFSELSIRSGRSADEIVEAVNRVSAILQTKKTDRIIDAATQELKYPGITALLQGSTKGGRKVDDFSRLGATLDNLRSTTGIGDFSQAIEAASRSRLGGGKWSQSEYIAAYSALSSTGALSGEEIEKALNSFMRNADPAKDLGEQLKNYDFARFVRGQQRKNAVKRGVDSLSAEGISYAVSASARADRKTKAEELAENMRRLQAKKDELMAKLIPALMPVVEKLAKLAESGVVEKILNGAVDFFTWGMDLLLRVVKKIGEWLEDDEKHPTDNSQNLENTQKTQSSMGGITHGLTLAGERGQEMIIPLDYSRRGRAVNIVNNFSQVFNTPTSTVNSMAASVRGSRWANVFMNGR